MKPLILASTSAYRRELLARLRLPFDIISPDVDETPQPDETPTGLAIRLARAKARAVATLYPEARIVGSDQVAALNGEIFGKPGHFDAAFAQLSRMSGQEVVFHTALALVDGIGATEQFDCIPTRVRFRQLSEGQIRRYLKAEPAFDCAGSAKCEGLGITLLDAISSDDPTAIIGLPLIALSTMLLAAGVVLP